MLYSFVCTLAVICTKIFFRLEVVGFENIPRKGGIIIASNHLSLLDPIIVAAACLLGHRKIEFMAKAELFRNRIFGRFISYLHAFPISRNRRDITAIKEAMKRLKAGKVLLMFPEGQRSKDANLLDAQSGIGLLAKRTNTPILPTFIKGTDRALPKGGRFIRPKKVTVYFGDLYSIEEKELSYSQIAEQAMSKVMLLGKESKNFYNYDKL